MTFTSQVGSKHKFGLLDIWKKNVNHLTLQPGSWVVDTPPFLNFLLLSRFFLMIFHLMYDNNWQHIYIIIIIYHLGIIIWIGEVSIVFALALWPRPGMMPILHSPGLMMPGQLGPGKPRSFGQNDLAFRWKSDVKLWMLPSNMRINGNKQFGRHGTWEPSFRRCWDWLRYIANIS